MCSALSTLRHNGAPAGWLVDWKMLYSMPAACSRCVQAGRLTSLLAAVVFFI
jgi:hypothetical protein